MENKKQPERMCAVCRKKADKTALIRIVKNNNGEIIIDKTHKQNGRGLYICWSEECIKKAIKTRVLNRGFKVEIDTIVYEELEKFYEKYTQS